MSVYAVTAAFVALDMVTGVVKAFKNKAFTSSVMREGLFHKSGSLMCVVLATLVDYAQTFLDLGVTIPVNGAVCTYIVIMEIGSIIENVCEINPEIMPEKLQSFFIKLNKGGESNEDVQSKKR